MDGPERIHPTYYTPWLEAPLQRGIRLAIPYVVVFAGWLGVGQTFGYLGHTLIDTLGLLMWVASAGVARMVPEQAANVATKIKFVLGSWVGMMWVYRIIVHFLAGLSATQLGAALGVNMPDTSAMGTVGWFTDMLLFVMVGTPAYYLYWLFQVWHGYRGRRRITERIDEYQRRSGRR